MVGTSSFSTTQTVFPPDMADEPVQVCSTSLQCLSTFTNWAIVLLHSLLFGFLVGLLRIRHVDAQGGQSNVFRHRVCLAYRPTDSLVQAR